MFISVADTMTQKRIRSLNWDDEEKQLLRSVLKQHVEVIENKSLDTNTNKTKNKAWAEVYLKFNELNRRPRHMNQLKIQWKTMKINARKTLSSHKNEKSETGGGVTPPMLVLNPAELLISQNGYDSDGIIPSSISETFQDTKPTLENLQVPMPKRRIITNKITEKGLKSRKDLDDYLSSMTRHMKMLKDKEHTRRMEMAEEAHALKIAIQKEKLKCVIIERDILEFKKVCEQNL